MSRIFRGLSQRPAADLEAGDVKRLYPEPHATSISRLETLARCPFQHFARYGLRLAPRPTAQVDSAALGQVCHLMLEHVFGDLARKGRTLRDASAGELVESLDRVRRKVLPAYAERTGLDLDAINARQRQTDRELGTVFQAHRGWPAQPQPVAREIAFGGTAAGLPALSLRTPRGRVIELHGKIDRIDVIKTDKTTLGIVYDYKRSTAAQRLSLAEVYHGLALQLLAYLLVVREHGKRFQQGDIRPAAAFYLPLLGGFKLVKHREDANEHSFHQYAPFDPRGVVDFEWIGWLDPALTEPGSSRVYHVMRKQDGHLGRPDQSDGVTGRGLDLLLEHVRAQLAGMADRWLDGEIAVQPRRFGDALPCRQCEFRPVCRFEVAGGATVNLETLSRSDVLKRLEGEST